jgi:hypothetical protein
MKDKLSDMSSDLFKLSIWYSENLQAWQNWYMDSRSCSEESCTVFWEVPQGVNDKLTTLERLYKDSYI